MSALFGACSGDPATDGGSSGGSSSGGASGGNTGGAGLGGGDSVGGAGGDGSGGVGLGGAGGDGSGGVGLGGAGGDGSGGYDGAGGPCPAGSFLADPEDPKSCTACPPRTFSTELDSTSCTEHSNCSPWGFFDEGSSTSGVICTNRLLVQFGTSGYDSAHDLTVDSDGNVYVAGTTSGPLDGGADLDPDHPSAYLRKYDARGRLVWTRLVRGDKQSSANKVALDSKGDIVLAGEITSPPSTETNVLVRKYDAGGELLWERRIGSSEADSADALALDPSGNIFIAGNTRGEIGGPYAGSLDAFVFKLSPRGEMAWSRRFATPFSEEATALAVDSKGDILVAGSTASVLGQNSFGGRDGFVRKYDADGEISWTRQFGSVERDEVTALALGSDDEIYLVGLTYGEFVAPQQGSVDAFLHKLDANGDALWTRQFGSPAIDIPSSVVLTQGGNVVIAGRTQGDLGGEQAGGQDGFLASFDAEGAHLWSRQLGSDEDDELNSLALGPNGTLFACGFTRGYLGREPLGSGDAFILPLIKH